MQRYLTPAGQARADRVPTRASYDSGCVMHITPHLPPPAPEYFSAEWNKVENNATQIDKVCQGLPETEIFGSYTTAWPDVRTTRDMSSQGPMAFRICGKLKARRQCSTLLVDPIYSDAGESSTQEPGPEQLVAKIWDPALLPYESAMSTNPMLFCQRTYSTEVNAYRQLKGLEEMPTFHGSFITTIDDDDGERIAGLILISFVNGVQFSALQMVPEKLFVDLLAMDMKMAMREILYTDYRTKNMLAVDDGSRLVLVDYGEALPSPGIAVYVEDEEALVMRWFWNFCEEDDMVRLAGSKGKMVPYPEVDRQWVRGLVQQAMERRE